MGQNCEKFIGMCLESVKNSDAIIYCDGGSEDNTLNIFHNFYNKYRCVETENSIGFNTADIIIANKYNQEDKEMNGKQRNYYLKYLKENFPNDWALCLDADEFVEDLDKIKKFIQTAKPDAYYVHMRHFIQDLGHEDATVEKHFVPNRLFKINEAEQYPLTEHPILEKKDKSIQLTTDCTCIWHLAYIPNLWDIKRRYENHLKKSNIHTPQFLKQWYWWHIFGTYPKKEFDLVEIPNVILKEFNIDKDELYFRNRGLEIKHSIMVKQFYDFFRPTSVLDVGCGCGCYLYYWSWFVDNILGIEISEWAVNNSFVPNKIIQGDITINPIKDNWDLITCIDILEHLKYEDLNKVLQHISEYGNKFLFSIPFVGDENLLKDKTHIIKENRNWWIKKIENHNIKIIPTPEHFLFYNQILVGVKNG
jgi:2-polyprenyl-3-methyl-5-hydroxy-6-metoxy-1,4-benzoquinol methylase